MNALVIKCPVVLRLHRGRQRRWLPKRLTVIELHWRHLIFALTAEPGKGICCVAGTVRTAHVGPSTSWPYRWERPSMKKRTAKAAENDVRHVAAIESNILRDLLPLVEHCCVKKYDDGDPREPGWIQIRTQGAAWSVTVKDPDTCTSFQAVADTLDKALETAALLLSCDDAPWERDIWLEQSKARSGRKK